MKTFLKSSQLTFALFAIYLIALYWIIVLKFNISEYHANAGLKGSINWIPFREALLYGIMDLPEIILNILIFVPFGLYAGVVLESWSFAKKVALFFSISFFFEVSQYILKIGAFDVTDLINNTIGGMIGLLIFSVLIKAFEGRPKAQKFINVIALIGTIAVFSFLLFLKLNNLWIFRMELIQK